MKIFLITFLFSLIIVLVSKPLIYKLFKFLSRNALNFQVSAEYKLKEFIEFMHIQDKCGAENNVPEAVLRLYRRDKYDDANAPCHIKCMAKKLEVFDETRGLLVDNLVKQVAYTNALTKEQSREVVTQCMKEADEHKSDSCAFVANGLKCLYRHGYGVIRSGDVGVYEATKREQEQSLNIVEMEKFHA